LTSVLVVSTDHIGSRMAGPGIRYLWFARELARRGHEVTLVVPFATDLGELGFEVRVDNPWHSHRMTPLARRHGTVIAQSLPVPTMLALTQSPTRAIYDLYSPPAIEQAALDASPSSGTERAANLNRLVQRMVFETGDAFICASERQRDLWLGALAAVGRIDRDGYRRDPSFRSLIDVVPFGIDPEPPTPGAPVLKGVFPGIEASDKVALWGGGMWDWLDPLTVIHAVHRLGRPDVKLFFLGTRRPNRGVPSMAMETRVVGLAEALGLLGRAVFVNDRWVPFEERASYLLEADVGVSAHRDELEARFAYRTRLLDCIWTGLPIVTSAGESVAEVVSDRELGRVVECGDADGYALALSEVLDEGKDAYADAIAATRPQFEWPRVVDTLERMLEPPSPFARRRPARVLPVTSYAVARARLALSTRGIDGLVRRGAAGLSRSLRGDHAAHPDAVPGAARNERTPPAQRLP
jgi:glycosyltransferase involved in cell wall biosynthesis